MARPLRIEYPGAWYHVMNRGAGRRTVFPDDDLRRMFLDLLADVHERYDACCHAFCLMGNHYHLLMHTPCAGLARAMRHIDGVYTQRHNRARDTDGPLFRGRYKAQLVEDGEYLWTVSRYIHRNPVEAGLCRNPARYKWSSYRYFSCAGASAPAWLHLSATLTQFQSRNAYRCFVEGDRADADAESQLLSAADTQSCTPILGSDQFVERMLKRLDFDYEIPPTRPDPHARPLEPLVLAVCDSIGWSPAALRAANDRQWRHRRGLLITALRRSTTATLKDIGAVFAIHYSTVASIVHRCQNGVASNRRVAGELERITLQVRKIKNGKT